VGGGDLEPPTGLRMLKGGPLAVLQLLCELQCPALVALLRCLGMHSRRLLRFRRCCRGLAGCSSFRCRLVRRRQGRNQSRLVARLVRCCRGFSLAISPIHSTTQVPPLG
jgi:hypothetical protein